MFKLNIKTLFFFSFFFQKEEVSSYDNIALNQRCDVMKTCFYNDLPNSLRNVIIL